MSNEVTNLRDTIIPKSDQLNADQLLGSDMTIRVTSVSRGSGDDQPVVVHYEGENGRPYKPCKSMRKVLIFAWGENGNDWIGKMATLYNKTDVKWGGVAVGGIRISHLSHIERDIQLSLAETKGKKAPIIVKRLDVADPAIEARAMLDAAARNGMDSLKVAWAGLRSSLKASIGPDGCPDQYKRIAQQADQARVVTPTAGGPGGGGGMSAAVVTYSSGPAPATPPADPPPDAVGSTTTPPDTDGF